MSIKSKYTCIIVDDERKARKLLRYKIEEHIPELNILGDACDAKSAYDLIHEVSPDIVFLDISMPVKSGLELLPEINSMVEAVIFVTGYDHYAIEAINHKAQGYILKPINDEQLRDVTMNVIDSTEEKLKHELEIIKRSLQKEPRNKDKNLGIPCNEGLKFIKIKDIINCEGWQKYTKVHLKSGDCIVSSYNIGEFFNILHGYQFMLVHRSHLINLHEIKKYLKDGTLYLSNDTSVPVSRRKRKLFLDTITRI